MTKNEVVALLEECKSIRVLIRCKDNAINDRWEDVTPAIEEAIRCVELHDKLVHAFEISTKIAESRGYNIEKARKLIKKAKGEE